MSTLAQIDTDETMGRLTHGQAKIARTLADGEPANACSECGTTYDTPVEVIAHVRAVHSDSGPAADPACVFCRIVAVYEPADVVATWDDAIAIVPLEPVTPGHVLILPRTHVPDFFTDPQVTAATAARAAEFVRSGSWNLITSAGPASTQTIGHLHLHLVPRVLGDGLALPWHPGRQDAELERLRAENAALTAQVRAATAAAVLAPDADAGEVRS